MGVQSVVKIADAARSLATLCPLGLLELGGLTAPLGGITPIRIWTKGRALDVGNNTRPLCIRTCSCEARFFDSKERSEIASALTP